MWVNKEDYRELKKRVDTLSCENAQLKECFKELRIRVDLAEVAPLIYGEYSFSIKGLVVEIIKHLKLHPAMLPAKASKIMLYPIPDKEGPSKGDQD